MKQTRQTKNDFKKAPGTFLDTSSTPGSCIKTGIGHACTSWVLEKGNMDYLG